MTADSLLIYVVFANRKLFLFGFAEQFQDGNWYKIHKSINTIWCQVLKESYYFLVREKLAIKNSKSETIFHCAVVHIMVDTGSSIKSSWIFQVF